jgi:hypothetical protein
MRASRPDSLFYDQRAAMTAARDNGLIGAVGLSNVTLPHLLHALKSTEIACRTPITPLRWPPMWRDNVALGHPRGGQLRKSRATVRRRRKRSTRLTFRPEHSPQRRPVYASRIIARY